MAQDAVVRSFCEFFEGDFVRLGFVLLPDGESTKFPCTTDRRSTFEARNSAQTTVKNSLQAVCFSRVVTFDSQTIPNMPENQGIDYDG